MVNFRLVYKIIGSLLFLLGTLLLICACIAFYYNEDDAIPFVISMLFTICCGFILKFLGRDADNNLNRRDSYLLVTATWIIFSLFGMLPFLISGYINNVTDAFLRPCPVSPQQVLLSSMMLSGCPMPLSIGAHRHNG